VLSSREYLARFENQTPWSKRCLGKAVVFRRWACEQTRPGNADPDPRATRVLLVAAEAPIALPMQARHFVASSGTPAHIALAELSEDRIPAAKPGWWMRLYRAYAA
jgi:hypothetical protein